MAFAGFWWLLLAFGGCCSLLLVFAGFCWLLVTCVDFRRLLLAFVAFCFCGCSLSLLCLCDAGRKKGRREEGRKEGREGKERRQQERKEGKKVSTCRWPACKAVLPAVASVVSTKRSFWRSPMSLLGSRTEKQLSFWRHEPEGRRPQQDQKKIPQKNGKNPLKKTRPDPVSLSPTC